MHAREAMAEKGWPATMLVLLVAIALFFYFAVVSLHSSTTVSSLHLSASHFSLSAPATTSKILTPTTPVSGQALFGQYCGVCHMDGLTGNGIASVRMPSADAFVQLVRAGHATAPGYSTALLSDAQIAQLYSHMKSMASQHESNRSGPTPANQAPSAVAQEAPAIAFNAGRFTLPLAPPQAIFGLQDKSCVRCNGPPLA